MNYLLKVRLGFFKSTLVIFLFFIFTIQCHCGCPCSGLSSSYLRVNQLGYGWLIPDEQVDVDFNPAALNDIEGKRLFLGLSGNNDFNYETNSKKSFFGKYSFVAIPFKPVKCAVRYKPLLATTEEKYNLYSYTMDYKTLTDEFELMAFVGFPVKYNIKTGLALGANTYDYYSIKEYNSKSMNDIINKIYTQNYLIKTGAIFVLNYLLSVGGAAGVNFGTTKYIDNSKLTMLDDNLKLTFFLLPEFRIVKPSETIIWRSYLSLVYESILSSLDGYSLWINEDERYYNLNTEVGTGLYYELQKKAILTCGIKFNWVVDNKNRIYGINQINTKNYNGIDFLTFAGVETPVFVDWIFLRMGYAFLKMKNYNYLIFTEQNAYLISKYKKNDFEFVFLPAVMDNFNCGMGVQIGSNVYLNINFGRDLFDLYYSKNELKTFKYGFELNLNFVFE